MSAFLGDLSNPWPWPWKSLSLRNNFEATMTMTMVALDTPWTAFPRIGSSQDKYDQYGQ